MPNNAHRPPNGESFPLAMATEGCRVRISALRAGRNLDRRLTDLGLNLGSVVEVIQRQGAGLVLARENSRVAIGGGMAMKIMVVPAD